MLSETDVVAEVEEITVRRLRLWVRRGWVVPTASRAGHAYDQLDLARVRLVCQLKDEMKLNDEAIPVVLSLMDQLYGIRREFKAMTEAIDQQPEDIRTRLRKTYSSLLDR